MNNRKFSHPPPWGIGLGTTRKPRKTRSGTSTGVGQGNARPSKRERRKQPALTQDEMQRQLKMLLNDHQQAAKGRRIAGITTTNTVTTTYKEGDRPTVRRTSVRVSN